MTSPPRASLAPLSTAPLWLASAAALAIALAVAPRVLHNYDVVDCFLTWARASNGRRPWAIYLTRFPIDDCDYPPVVPYLLTLVERARLALGAGEAGATAIVLVKLPNIVAWLAHVPLCAIGLRRPLGARAARLAAILIALSPPLFVNAAAWGQFDGLLCLFVVAAMVAALNGRHAGHGGDARPRRRDEAPGRGGGARPRRLDVEAPRSHAGRGRGRDRGGGDGGGGRAVRDEGGGGAGRWPPITAPSATTRCAP